MALKVTNNASTTIAGSINAAATAINLAGGTGSLFPVLSGSDWFWGTLVDASNNIEVVKVTARSTDALTVVRGQDGTTAKSYTVGDRFELRPTAALFNDKADIDNPTFTTGITSPAITLGATALTATGAELNYMAGVTSAIQTQLDSKAPLASPTFTGTATVAALTSTGVVDISASVLKGATPIAFDGATAGTNKTSIAVTDPTANRTITVPDADVDLTKVRAASTTLDGVSRLSTTGEAQTGSSASIGVTPAGLNATVIGMGQFYQDMTASRASGVTYTNSTGRTIVVSAWGTTGGTTNQRAQCYVGGGLISDNSAYANGVGYTATAYFLVPAGVTYSITFTNVSSITKWYELR